jgi:PPOX class probable F420-dependent enzyme
MTTTNNARIQGRARELIQAPNFCVVSCLRPDGGPDAVVTWIDVDGDDLLLNTADGRRWPGFVRNDPRVALTVINMENPYEYVTVRGRVAGETTDGADEHIDAMAKKYLGEDRYPFRQPGEVRVVFRVEPESVSVHGG